MSAAAVQTGQAAHSPYSATANYLEQNAESYYNNVVASGGASLSTRPDVTSSPYASSAPSQPQSSQAAAGYAGHTQRGRDAALANDQYDGAPSVPIHTSSSQPPDQRVVTSGGPSAASASASQRNKQPNTPEADRANTRKAVSVSTPERQPRSTGTRDRSAQSRPEANMAPVTAPAPLVREHSEVLNRVVVSDPRVDAERVKERVAEAQPVPINDVDDPVPRQPQQKQPQDPAPAGTARRQDYSKSSSSRRRDVQFGDYILGQTLGEGEFGKVKLGWKRDGSTQVAIKLIRRDSVQNHPGRLPKIYREISILQDLAHPNIVRLHEMVETERQIGIILEYASGGELFDYILNNRYLKDPAARRLFAQLVSGVGYLHKKGIVHRDLKLENLLLDQNRNIIITDFGFANTFNPADTLSDEIEYNLSNKDFVRKFKLDRLDAQGMRRGDLMQTSCGSPCYAAPELVVSDSLYTGRKVDVWSCGVILYAMLAGYLPFDDDPANPEGDNINLLYKYITTTPLTFPEYVSPHARDLLRRILIPDPRKRADLFEVATHSWLSEYQHVVSHVTSSTTNIAEISNSTLTLADPPIESSAINRSASVRDSSKPNPHTAPKTAIARTPEGVQDIDQISSGSRREKATRHTLQTEYVPAKSHTTRAAANAPPSTSTSYPPPAGEPSKKTVAAAGAGAGAVVAAGAAGAVSGLAAATKSSQKQLPSLPPDAQSQGQDYHQSSRVPSQQKMPPPVRPARDAPRSTSDVLASYGQSSQYAARPTTQGSVASASGPARSDPRLPSRGSYGQPVAPTVAATNAEGRVTQPTRPARAFNYPPPSAQQHGRQPSAGPPTAQSMPPSSYQQQQPVPQKTPHHRRSSTLSGLGEKLFGRSASVRKKDEERAQKASRKYPPTSMKPYQVQADGADGPAPSRLSSESKRSFSFGLGKKRSTDLESQTEKSTSRRFSLLPPSWSFKSSKDYAPEPSTPQTQTPDYLQHASGVPVHSSQPDASYHSSAYDDPRQMRATTTTTTTNNNNNNNTNNFTQPPQPQAQAQSRPYQPNAAVADSQSDYDSNTVTSYHPRPGHARGASQPLVQGVPQYRDGVPDRLPDPGRTSMQQSRPSRTVLTKQSRRYADGYEQQEPDQYYQRSNHHYSSSSAAVRKVQDFFRRKGRPRADSNYS